jgi:hypothetical protein
MIVVKITCASGRVYYNDQFSPALMMAILDRVPDWVKLEKIEMTSEEYFAIPVTQEAADLFRVLDSFGV